MYYKAVIINMKVTMVVWTRKAPHRLMYLNSSFLVGDSIWGDYRSLRRWNLVGGRMSESRL